MLMQILREIKISRRLRFWYYKLITCQNFCTSCHFCRIASGRFLLDSRRCYRFRKLKQAKSKFSII